jgi:hypothetical protein
MFVQFNPGFTRFPHWGPFGATQGGLPEIAPSTYILYFLGPALIALVIANRMGRRFGWRRPWMLLGVGLTIGMAWDATMELLATHAWSLWVFSRSAPGLTAFPGSRQQVPAYVFIAMGAFIMWATYLLGRTNDDGAGALDSWVAARTRPGWPRYLATASAYIAVCNLLYLVVYAPHVITKSAHLLTQAGAIHPFAGIPIQPGGGTAHDGIWGAVIILGWLIGAVAVTFISVHRWDPRQRLPVAPSSPTAPHRQLGQSASSRAVLAASRRDNHTLHRSGWQ